ncbi:MAG: hypothetical protein GF401_21065 [Chitinivibrionales bacterium]|nr:hypothetical protein [Chitinivibrionales bacterium]
MDKDAHMQQDPHQNPSPQQAIHTTGHEEHETGRENHGRHHGHTIADFKRRFWVSLVATIRYTSSLRATAEISIKLFSRTEQKEADMKARIVMVGIIATMAIAGNPYAQMRGRGGMGGGMGGHCPMCGRKWDGNNYYAPDIPDSLPVPGNKKWLQRLDGVLAKERLSAAQYRKDVEKYRQHMPYSMVIPQEDNHEEFEERKKDLM